MQEYFPLTKLEIALKRYYQMKIERPEHVMSAEEMHEYLLWLMEAYSRETELKISFDDIPDLLNHPDIKAVARAFTQSPSASGNPKVMNALLSLYDSFEEGARFQEEQDITAGRFLRYFPAYWDTFDYFVIYYDLMGVMPVMFEQETLYLKPGSILFIPPGVRKASACLTDDCQVLFFMLRRSTFADVFHAHLTAENLMSYFFEKALSPENEIPYLLFQTGNDADLQTLSKMMDREYHAAGRCGPQVVNSLMNTFLLLLLERYEDTAEISAHCSFYWSRTYAEILRYIERHYAELTVDALAEHFGYSDRQMIRIIRSITGKTFTQLQTQMRMRQAARLLSGGSVSAEEISETVGYANSSSFFRAFRRYYGCTPGEFARRNPEDVKD